MRMKRILLAIVCLCVAFCCVACGNDYHSSESYSTNDTQDDGIAKDNYGDWTKVY